MDATRAQIQKNITLTQHILDSEHQHPEATGEFSTLLHAISIASKFTSSKVRHAGLFDLHGAEGTTNVQGENVKKLDVIANDAFITSLTRSGTTSLMVSEEDDDAIVVSNSSGKYIVCFDPLDGSSNIDVNISIGTIFAIYRRKNTDIPVTVEEALTPGRELISAGYTMYGSATVMVIALKGGTVDGFTLDPALGEFVISHPNMKIPVKRKIYSINEGNSVRWSDDFKEYVNYIKTQSYSARYVGSMVADVHRTLVYGGIFMYPADSKSKTGKLRLLYEANPMAFIINQAGGLSSDGYQPILDIQPTNIHQRTGVVMGSKEEVELLHTYTQKKK